MAETPGISTQSVRGTIERPERRRSRLKSGWIWKLVFVLLIVNALLSVTNCIERRRVADPIVTATESPATFRSSRNPYRHYEAAACLIPDEANSAIERYYRQSIGEIPKFQQQADDAELQAALSKVQTAVSEVQKGAACKAGDYRFVPKRDAVDENYPEFSPLRDLARVVSADGVWKLAHGRSAEGVSELLSVMRMGQDTRRDTGLIGRLVGMAQSNTAARSLYKAMGSSALSLGDCKHIASALERMQGERYPLKGNMTHEYLTIRKAVLDAMWPGGSTTSIFPGDEHGAGVAARIYFSIPGVKTMTIRNYDRMWKAILDNYDRIYPDSMRLDVTKMIPRYDLANRVVMPAVSLSRLRDALDETIHSGIMLMAALEAFKKEHGQYPAGLRELVGPYISKVPIDPFSADDLFQYSRRGEKYLLYSIGSDMDDNGGKPILSLREWMDAPGLDMVFAPGLDIWTKGKPGPGGLQLD